MTAYHTKYFAHELTKRCASDSIEKLATALSNAQVDLNPHQIEAALFAFRSPLSKGAILADEVGLGKTIEAVILLAQKDFLKLRNTEADKVRCGQRHFEAIGVPFAVVVTADEV